MGDFLNNFFNWKLIIKILPDLLTYGLLNTLTLALSATVIGLFVGLILALMGISRHAILRWPSKVFTDIFRGLPAILTILVVGQGFAVVTRYVFGQ